MSGWSGGTNGYPPYVWESPPRLTDNEFEGPGLPIFYAPHVDYGAEAREVAARNGFPKYASEAEILAYPDLTCYGWEIAAPMPRQEEDETIILRLSRDKARLLLDTLGAAESYYEEYWDEGPHEREFRAALVEYLKIHGVE